jgi:DNA-binding transcriptional LysR family regulator
VLITPRDGPLAVGPKARFADVVSLPYIGLNPESGLSRFLQDQARRLGTALHHRVRVKSFDAVTKLVASGVGVAIVPRHSTTRLRATNLRVCELQDAWCSRRLLVCRPKGAKASPHVLALASELMQQSSFTGDRPQRRTKQ